MAFIEIPEEEYLQYIEFLKIRIQDVDGRLAPLLMEKSNLETRLKNLLNKATGVVITPKGQPPLSVIKKNIGDTTIARIKYVLKEGKEFMTTREITDRIFELMPPAKDEKERLSKNISTVLSINQGADKIFNRKTENGINFFKLNKNMA